MKIVFQLGIRISCSLMADRTMPLFESLPWPIERAEQYEIPLIFIFEYNDDYSSYGDRGRDRKLTRIHQESTRAGEKGPK